MPISQPESVSRDKRTVFIQMIFESSVLEGMKAAIAPVINRIIRDELNLPQTDAFDFFMPKPQHRQAVTLYYADDLLYEGNSVFFSEIDPIINKIKALLPQKIGLSDQVRFFGDYGDELVILVDDQHKELTVLNSLVKTRANRAQNNYQLLHNTNLYDATKSERFSYVPHIGLGRIRSTSIKMHVKDEAQKTLLFERIKLRILAEILPIIQDLLTSENRKLQAHKLGAFDLGKRQFIKEYELD